MQSIGNGRKCTIKEQSGYILSIYQMIDLAFQPFAPNYKRCGCYISSEEYLKSYPNKHVMVPLRSIEYDLEVVNAIVSVALVQTYQNPTEKFLELEYSFPINPSACVYRFSAEFGKVRVEGVVKEKEQARKQYQQAVNEGKRAALGQIKAQSKDIMNLKVGNVGPGESVRIQIAYLQELSLSNNTFYQLHLPGTISPRYMNWIPKELLAKSCKKSGQVSSEGNFTWSFKISLKTTRKVVFFDSNSHDIMLVSQNDTQTLSEFAMTDASVPNKDFTFTYTTEDFQLPSSVYGSTDVSSSAMISFIPKFCPLNLDDAYKASVAGTPFQTDIQNAKGQYVFLLDRSGSMGGKRIEKAKEALILFIKSLPQDTYFNVVSFGSGSSKLFPNSVKYDDKQVEKAVKQIKKYTADMGGTEIYHPLKKLLEDKPTEGYPKQIFLLTDGGVSNTQGVIRMVGLNNKYARVHTIAVGNGASQDLILGCAKSGKGYHVFITDDENPSQKIIQLLSDSLSPVISKIQLKYDKNLVASVIPNPESLPYVLKGDLVNFYINFKGQLQQPTALSFSYEDSVTKLPYAADIEVVPEPKSHPFVDKMGQFKKIRLMQQSYANKTELQESMFYVKVVDKKAEIVKESVRHQILSEFTAFICVQQELIDGKYSEIKDKGKISVLVDNPLPIQYEEYQDESAICPMNLQMSAPSVNCSRGAVYGSWGAPRMQAMKCAMPAPKMMKDKQKQEMMPAPRMMMDKKKQSSGISSFFGNIASSISNAFSTSSKPQLEKTEARRAEFAKKRQAPMQCKMMDQERSQKLQVNAMADLAQDQEDIDVMMQELEEEIKTEKKKKKIKKAQEKSEYKPKKQEKGQKKAVTIESVIASQSTEGSWKDLSLLSSLYSAEVEEKVKNGEYVIAVLTYLVAKWIEKNHPQKQYSLLIKKSLNYVKKEIPNHEEFLKAYQDVVN